MMGFFISLEGIEGCGKTTQLRLLADWLRASDRAVLTTREPGGCAIADQIRAILLTPQSQALVPRAELLLYAAARAQHVDEVVRPALQAGKIVLCDRYTDATLAYQGGGRGLERSLIVELNALASNHLAPQLTLLLDLPVEIGLGRASSRNQAAADQEGRFEAESLDFHRRVQTSYRQLAAEEPLRFRLIDATGSVDQVHQRMVAAVSAFLADQPCP
jgi:dTMP kinase